MNPPLIPDNPPNEKTASSTPAKTPNEYLLDVWEKKQDVRDIFTSVIFEDDGSLVFKVVDDGFTFEDFADSTRIDDTTLYSVAANHRDEVFSAFLDAVPPGEAERRAALVSGLKVTLKKSSIENLLKSKGIAYKYEYFPVVPRRK